MKTNLSETSLTTIRELRSEGKTLLQKQKIIYHLFRNKKPKTRAEIAVQMGIDKGSVAGRINALIKSGVVMETMQTSCPTSGRTAWLVKLAPSTVNS